ncbi:MAG: class I SAM-dependent methyltransferase [Alphaproteobacteria bacterium]|nr:class I SAM-dependent methyltransferase [Alphaproteobacteria bacterium]
MPVSEKIGAYHSHRPFRGVAETYAMYRKPWPNDFLAEIAAVCRFDKTGSLLDLGCGTGQLAVPFSIWFSHVFALDLEKEMLVHAENYAMETGVKNISFLESAAEDFSEDLPNIKAVTIAQAFHWMKREILLSKLERFLPEDAVLILLNEARPELEPSSDSVHSAWRSSLKEAMNKWIGDSDPTLHPIYTRKTHQKAIDASNFTTTDRVIHQIERTLTVDEVIGRCLSITFCGPDYLKDRNAFVEDLRQVLSPHAAQTGKLSETVEMEALILRPKKKITASSNVTPSHK